MAMSKKEKAYLESVEIKAAMYLGEEIKPDIPPPTLEDGFETLTKGWAFNSYAKNVEVGCSGCHGHSIGQTDKTTSKNSIHLYSSRLLALKAMRHEVAMKVAKELRLIDIAIEKEVEANKG